MSLRIRLRKARMQCRLTQAGLGVAVGISQQVVQRIEAGAIKKSKYILKIANVLNVSPAWLEYGPGNELENKTNNNENFLRSDLSIISEGQNATN